MATEVLDVAMSAEDIANGIKKSCYLCPGALAINRALRARFGDPRLGVEVGYRGVFFSVADDDGERGAWRLGRVDPPDPLVTFIRAFDHNANVRVQPIAFKLPLTDALLEYYA